MAIEFTCPHCGSQTNVDDRFAGQTGPCRACGAPVTIPGDPTGPFATAPPAARGSSSASVWIIALVCAGGMFFVCGGILIALLLPAVQAAREAARRAQCTNNLKQIGLALQNYHDVHRSFPPAYVADENGRPLHSWRVLILPYLEQQPLYDRYNFNEPWDGPNNSQLAALMPNVYRCPSDAAGGPVSTTTAYAAVTGPGTLFDADISSSITDITDGMTNTIAVVEAANAGIPWLEPRDLDMNRMSFTINGSPTDISSHHPQGATVVFTDGHTSFLLDTIGAQLLRAIMTKAGGEPINGDF